MIQNTLPQSPISVTEYQGLLADISKIFEEAKDSTLIAVNKIRNHAYWLIGEKIVQIEQKGASRAEYGSHLIGSLAQDLSFKYGNGFSETNLRSMRKFYLNHPKQYPATELSWSHQRILLAIKDKQKRHYYEQVAQERHWSKRELRKALHDNKIEVEEDMVKESKKDKSSKTITLLPQRGRLSTYRLAQIDVESQGTLFVIDCGFKIYREVTLEGIYLFDDEEVIEIVQERDETKVQKSSPDNLYTYQAYLDRVVDGDTIIVNIDCGFGTWLNQRLRLTGIDCPSLSKKRGKKAKAYVEKALEEVDFLIIRSSKSDKYDRYLADIFYLPQEKNPHQVAAQGRFLNQELLDQNLAVPI